MQYSEGSVTAPRAGGICPALGCELLCRGINDSAAPTPGLDVWSAF